MDSQVNPPQDTYVAEDEISISELIGKLWAKRGLIVFLPLIFAGLTIAGLLLSKISTGDSVSYYLELTGTEKGTYPNGADFSPQDLLNPEVVSRLAEQFNIEQTSDVAQHVSVTYGTPLSIGVIKAYQAALSANSKAGPEEIEQINQRYRERIEDAAQRGLSITVDYVALGIDQTTGMQLARKLPALWSEVFSKRFQIFLDTGIASLSINSGDADIRTTVGVIEIDSRLRAIKKGTDILLNDGRLKSLRTADGVSPADLEARIDDFRRIYFEPIYSSSFSSNDSLALVYRRDMELEIEQLDTELTELTARIETIKELQRNDRGTSDASGQNAGGSQMQIQGDALGQLVSLSQQASLSEYLQDSFNTRLERVNAKAELESQLKKMGGAAQTTSRPFALSEEFMAESKDRYDTIERDYRNLLGAAQTTAEREIPVLYRVTSVVASDEKLLEKRDLLFIALALALGGMLAIIIALLLPPKADAA